VTNTSAHLQVLRGARLVTTRKHETRVFYRLSDEQVARLVAELRALAHARLAEVEQAVHAYLHAADDPEPVTRTELLQRLERGEVQVLDVRPIEEYNAGHIPGARAVPLEHLEAEIAQLSGDTEIVAYCRGPYCLLLLQLYDCCDSTGTTLANSKTGFPSGAWPASRSPSRPDGVDHAVTALITPSKNW
jgi:hypothetical protein